MLDSLQKGSAYDTADPNKNEGSDPRGVSRRKAYRESLDVSLLRPPGLAVVILKPDWRKPKHDRVSMLAPIHR
jgi:hypothetical protein